MSGTLSSVTGDIVSSTTLPVGIHDGYGIGQNNNKAAEWYERAAAQGHAMAEGKMADFYGFGVGGVKMDKKRSLDMLRRAAEHGEVIAMANLGRRYWEGEIVETNKEKGMEWLEKGAAMGDETSMLAICECLPDAKQVDEVVRRCNGLTQPRAMCNLGMMYEVGRGGLTKDENKAFEWYEKAGKLGDLNAQWNLHCSYIEAEGPLHDGWKAIEWLRKAAEGGDSEAQTELGLFYEIGQTVEADAKEATRWYRKAADQGHPRAQGSLGQMYEHVYHNRKLALEWSMRAAAQDYGPAMWNLYVYYRDEDMNIAHQWLTRSASADYELAQRVLSRTYVDGIYPRMEFDVKAANDWISQRKHNLF